jgi:hypothetical protein
MNEFIPMIDKTGWSEKALMTVKDADLFESILTEKAEQASGTVDVLEWGSGKSTRYFSSFLIEQATPFRWVSIEYDRAFYKSNLAAWISRSPGGYEHMITPGQPVVINQQSGSIDLVVFDYGELRPYIEGNVKDRSVTMDDYIGFPRSTERRFDVILVDGRKRRRCLIEAFDLLKENGVCLLHDAFRPYYHCALPAYPQERRVGDMLWVGSRAEGPYLEHLLAATC